MLIDSEALYYVPPYVSLDQVKSGVVKIEKQGYVKLTPDTLKLLSIFINPTTPVSAYKKLKALKLKKLKLSQNSFTELLLLFLKKNLLSRYPIKMGRGSWGAVPKIHVWKDQYTYFRLWHPMGLSLDDQVDIGRYCCIGDGVEFFLPSAGFDHDPENVSIYPLYNLYGKIDKTKGRLIPDSATFRNVGSPKKITVKNDVWIATESLIFPGSTIGNGAVISPRSVVSGHVPDYAIDLWRVVYSLPRSLQQPRECAAGNMQSESHGSATATTTTVVELRCGQVPGTFCVRAFRVVQDTFVKSKFTHTRNLPSLRD